MDNGASSYRRYLDGDDSAIADIVEEYKDGLILYLNTFVSNIYTAEELCEDTFFRLITKRPRYTGKSGFKAWLYTVGRNVTLNYIRHRRIIDMTPVEDVSEYISDGRSLELAYIKEEQKITLHRAMSGLNIDYRCVLWLVYFEGFSNEDTAKIMKKNSTQVKNLLYRAKLALKASLEKEGFVYEEL